MYRSGVRRAALVIAVLGAPALARADDPDRLFGFDDEPPPRDEDAAEVPCTDAPDFACVPEGAVITERLEPARLWDLGAGDGTWITAARRALGASTDPFAPAPAFAGASALENRWTLDGLPVDAVTDGAPELRVPLAFLRSIDVHSGGLPASARSSTGAVIDGHLRGGVGDDAMELRLWLGAGAPTRDLRVAPDTFDPLTLELDPLRSLTLVATVGARIERLRSVRAWWFAGFGFDADGDGTTRVAKRLRDADADGRYDRDDDGALITETIEARELPGHVFSVPYLARAGAGGAAVTLIGAVTDDARRSADGTVEATTVHRSTSVMDLLGTYRGRWGDTELSISGGWHHARRGESGADGVQRGTAFIPDAADVPDDAAVAEACARDPLALAPCPVATGYYARGGAGLLTGTTADRPTLAAEVARRFGDHRVALGATMEDARLRVHRRFSGGSIERALAEDIVFTTRFATCDGDVCEPLDSSTRIYRTRAIAGYLEDRWRPIAGLTVQGGLRWESMEVGTALRFRDQLAPRLAIAADPSERGKTRLFVSWGRYFPLLPASLGPAVVGQDDLLSVLDSGLGPTESINRGDPLDVADGIEPPMVEEVVAGAEAVVVDRLHLGFTYRERWLRRGLDDVALELTNPALLRRDSRDVLAWFGNAPDAGVHVRVGYARTRQDGSWAGPFDPTEGTTLYRSSFEGAPNSLGRLPLDTPHRLFIETIARRRLGGWDLTLGARFQLASGMPVGVVAGADGEVPLLPRGDAGRTPTTSSATLHVGLVRRGWSIGLDVVDVFDRRAPVAVDQRWTMDDVQPIEGGDEADLLWLRTIDGDRARVNASYGAATRYAPPVAARLSATLTY